MKTGIKRIEQTLNRLQNAPKNAVNAEGPIQANPSGATIALSFDLKSSRIAPPAPLPTVSTTPIEPPPQNLHLPKPKTVALSPHRNAANPALSRSILQDMLLVVETWETELAQITKQIQNLYLDGPIIDGWLESAGSSSPIETVAFRHADITQLVKFIEQLQSGEIIPDQISAQNAAYRLCGLNADGQLWHYPCPADQVPAVSVAIARYHQLRQLRTRQQNLEDRLAQFSENLVRLHSQLKD
jgi:hypothetical protein